MRSPLYTMMSLSEASILTLKQIIKEEGIPSLSNVTCNHITLDFGVKKTPVQALLTGHRGRGVVGGVRYNENNVVIEIIDLAVETATGWVLVNPILKMVASALGKERPVRHYHVTHSFSDDSSAKNSNSLLREEEKHRDLFEPYFYDLMVEGTFGWVDGKGEKHFTLDNCKKYPQGVGLAHSVLSEVGTAWKDDEKMKAEMEKIIKEKDMVVDWGYSGCGIWPVSDTLASYLKVGMVKANGREVRYIEHRDDNIPCVAASEVTEEVLPSASCFITYSLLQILIDPDLEREKGKEYAKEWKAGAIQAGYAHWVISIQGNSEDVGVAPPTPHRVRQKLENKEPISTNDVERSKSFWYNAETNPEGWCLTWCKLPYHQ